MPEPLDPAGFPVEADRFAGQRSLDFSVTSVAEVDAWVRRPGATDADRVGAGCYVGEVLRRALGGAWQPDGTLTGIGHVAETHPLAKVHAGEDLVTYVADVLRYAR